MKTNARYILIALMVLIASAPFLLPGIMVFQKALIVHQITERLEREELEEIRVERNNIRWIKPGKELWVGNRMFDVDEIKYDGDSLVIKGLFDDKEKEIIGKMSSLSAPLPFEKERCSTIYQITHLESFISPQQEELLQEQQMQIFPELLIIYPVAVQQAPFAPPDNI